MSSRLGKSATRLSTARSLADDVRGRSDAELSLLILARPDLARPAPADLTSLAARASTRASVQRAIETLDRGHLQVLEALVAAGDGADPGAVARLMGTDVDLTPHLERLWARALLWRAPEGLRVVRTVPDVMGPHVAGLGPPAAELLGAAPAQLADPEELAGLIASAPAPSRVVLDRLAWGPPVGVLGEEGPCATAVRWLLDRHLVVLAGADRVVLPREVGLALRGGRVHAEPLLSAPEVATAEVPGSLVDAVAGGQVSDLLALVEELAAQWGPEPPRVLRSGGLAGRDLRRVARHLDLDEDRAAWLVETAHAAGLFADDGETVPVWAPTASYDEWLGRDAGMRWAHLAGAWLASGRAAHLVGSRQDPARAPANALGPDALWPPIRAIRAEVLAEVAELPAGRAPTVESLTHRLAWRRPLRNVARLQEAAVAVLREAEWLGVTGRGVLSGPGRALASGDDAATLGSLMAAQLPQPVDHLLLQADLTAVAPGPLVGSLSRLMRLAAEVESRGGATVYRFGPQSVRRALDSGLTADELLDRLGKASRTPVPQPLDYLVRDVGRRHGRTRVGATSAYVRSDDEAVLESMVADRNLTALRLRRIAPTVVVSPADPLVLLEQLRDSGYPPVQEGADGSVIVAAARHRRAAPRRTAAAPVVTAVDKSLTVSLVAGLRAAEQSAVFRRAHEDPLARTLTSTDPTVTLAVLRDAAADRLGVWIGYADAAGATTRHLFYPTRIEGGRASGMVGASGQERTFSVHRITGVAPA